MSASKSPAIALPSGPMAVRSKIAVSNCTGRAGVPRLAGWKFDTRSDCSDDDDDEWFVRSFMPHAPQSEITEAAAIAGNRAVLRIDFLLLRHFAVLIRPSCGSTVGSRHGRLE